MTLDISNNEILKEILKNVIITGFISNFSLILLFIAKNILLFNWVNKNIAKGFILYLAYIELFVAFIIITPLLLPKFFQEAEKKPIYVNLFTALFLMLINILIISLIFLFLIISGFQFNINQIPEILFLFILIISVFMIHAFKIVESAYYGLRDVKRIGFLNLFLSFIFILLLIFFKLIRFLNIYTVILIYLITYFSSLILNLSLKFKKVKRESFLGIDVKLGKKMIIFSYPLLLMGIFYFINFRAGIIILSLINETYSIYYYLATSFVILFISFIGIPLNKMTYSYMVEFIAKNKIKEIKETYNFILLIISFLEIGGLILIYNFSPIIIKLLYSKYENMLFVTFFKFIIIGGIFYSLNQFLGKMIIANGKTKINLLAELLGGVANVTFFILSLKYENLFFISFGFICSTMIILLIYYYFTKKNMNFPSMKLKVFRIIVSFMISLLIYEIFTYFISVLYLSILISLIVYFLTLIFLKVISFSQITDFIFLMLKILRGKIFK